MNHITKIRHLPWQALKITALLTICLSLVPSGIINAQYLPTGLYLNNPDKIIGYIDSCAVFWQGVQDKTHGGFYMDVDRAGNVFNTSLKNTVSQSRDAYGFVRAFMMTGNEEYLDLANSALTFMNTYLWDAEYGGWYNECNSDGSNPNDNAGKTAFDQHYALLGFTAFAEATGDSNAWNVLESGYEFNEKYLWDNRSEYLGYYDYIERDGSAARAKSFNATVDAITTHLYNLYLMTGEQKYKLRLLQLKDNIIDYLVASMADQTIGFAELYQTDWSIDNNQKRTIMGHVLKTAWCLARIYRIDPDPAYLVAAEQLVADVWNNGYDHEYGGPYKDYDRTNGQMYMYGAQDTAKAWWQMEQAMTAGLLLYEITGEDWYLQMADQSLEFFRKYFIDHTYGEVYADRSRSGGRVSWGGGYWDENKGSPWKAAYHSIETGYYAYLYGKLVITVQPVTLYYRYDAYPYERNIRMNPLAIDFDKLAIKQVMHSDTVYTNVDFTNRILTLPANTQGIFAVTYYMTDPSTVRMLTNTYPNNIELLTNYPNPFNNATTIRFALVRAGHVELAVYNSRGQKVAEVLNSQMGAGAHAVYWNAEGLSSGVYFYVLSAESKIKTEKMVLIK